MMRVAPILLCLAMLACAPTPIGPVEQVLTPRELNAHPDLYAGREVVVQGYMVLGSNARALYQSRETFDEANEAFRALTPGFDPTPFYADCLTLLNAGLVEENRSTFNSQTITVRGRFERNYRSDDVLDLQACGGPTAIVLDDRDTRRVLRSLQRAQ